MARGAVAPGRMAAYKDCAHPLKVREVWIEFPCHDGRGCRCPTRQLGGRSPATTGPSAALNVGLLLVAFGALPKPLDGTRAEWTRFLIDAGVTDGLVQIAVEARERALPKATIGLGSSVYAWAPNGLPPFGRIR